MTAPLVFIYLASFKILDNQNQTQIGPFREPTARVEVSGTTEMLAQIQEKSLATLEMWAAGRDLDQTIFLYLHRRDLHRRSLLDATTGMPTKPRIGDRLDEIKSRRGVTVVKISDPPGAYVVAVIPASFGPDGINALYEIKLTARKSSR